MGLGDLRGVGGRTRRGFGAFLREGAPPPKEEEIRARLRAYGRERGWPEGVPHLTPQSPLKVFPLSWREVAQRYNQFRQWRASGRSLWPEPRAIRHLLQKAPRPEDLPLKFPRGQFGLPIVFHFRDEKGLDATLQGESGQSRLASPLLIRPLGERATLVAILEAPRVPPGGVVLEGRQRVRVEVLLSPEEAAQIQPLGGNPDPLRAFMDYL